MYKSIILLTLWNSGWIDLLVALFLFFFAAVGFGEFSDLFGWFLLLFFFLLFVLVVLFFLPSLKKKKKSICGVTRMIKSRYRFPRQETIQCIYLPFKLKNGDGLFCSDGSHSESLPVSLLGKHQTKFASLLVQNQTAENFSLCILWIIGGTYCCQTFWVLVGSESDWTRPTEEKACRTSKCWLSHKLCEAGQKIGKVSLWLT